VSVDSPPALAGEGRRRAVMATAITRHEVTDPEAWLAAYREGTDVRIRGKVLADRVFRDADRPNTIIVLHDFATLEDARGMMESPMMPEVWQRSGVVGEPVTWLAEEI
jgi:hypothetical protein